MPPSPSPIEAYLATVASDRARTALAALRSSVLALVPDGEEVISYGVPAIKRGGVLVWFAAFKHHCSLFAGTTVGDFSDRLDGFRISKGTIQFTPEHPIPEDVVRDIVLARLALVDAARARPRRRRLSAG
jgi:uncharacterized protein YdhG (YjbR/CyaY superfamily)